ncbi:MAG: hypothetical protein PHP25_01280 [Candidatus Moranbacteria bacterium]|nr:hypothetical protein [Candidatus Moranbacteria bacterium]
MKPVNREKFLHNLVNVKKRNPHYKHCLHKMILEAENKVSFQVFDNNKKSIVYCDIDFYPDDNLVDIECQPCDPEKLESLLVFDLLEAINEKAAVRFVDTKIYFAGDASFFVTDERKKEKVYRISRDRERLLDAGNSRTVAEIIEETKKLDFI